jgi:hypothetical protein
MYFLLQFTLSSSKIHFSLVMRIQVTCHMLSLKFHPHRATRTPHHQNRKEVIHGTRLIPQHSKRVKTIQNDQKSKGALQNMGACVCARNSIVQGCACAHEARLFGEKPARLLNGAFIETGRLPNH